MENNHWWHLLSWWHNLTPSKDGTKACRQSCNGSTILSWRPPRSNGQTFAKIKRSNVCQDQNFERLRQHATIKQKLAADRPRCPLLTISRSLSSWAPISFSLQRHHQHHSCIQANVICGRALVQQNWATPFCICHTQIHRFPRMRMRHPTFP